MSVPPIVKFNVRLSPAVTAVDGEEMRSVLLASTSMKEETVTVGAILSTVTDPVPMVLETVPLVPAWFLGVTDTVTNPLGSVDCTRYVAE